MKGQSVHACLFIFFIAAWFISPDAGKRIVVPTHYPSVQKAIDQAEEYDTVFIKKGTYHESIHMRDAICLIGEHPDSTIIKGNGADPVGGGIHCCNATTSESRAIRRRRFPIDAILAVAGVTGLLDIYRGGCVL